MSYNTSHGAVQHNDVKPALYAPDVPGLQPGMPLPQQLPGSQQAAGHWHTSSAPGSLLPALCSSNQPIALTSHALPPSAALDQPPECSPFDLPLFMDSFPLEGLGQTPNNFLPLLDAAPILPGPPMSNVPMAGSGGTGQIDMHAGGGLSMYTKLGGCDPMPSWLPHAPYWQL